MNPYLSNKSSLKLFIASVAFPQLVFVCLTDKGKNVKCCKLFLEYFLAFCVSLEYKIKCFTASLIYDQTKFSNSKVTRVIHWCAIRGAHSQILSD